MPGRVSRTALLGVLAAGLGAGLFEDAGDPWLTVAPFVLVVFATSALTAELTAQAQRDRGNPLNRWARSDTAIVVTLAVLATLLTVSFAFANRPAGERTAAVCFAALYVLLAGYFWQVRRKSLAHRRAD